MNSPIIYMQKLLNKDYEQMFNEKKLTLSKNVILSKNVNPIVPMTNAFAVVEKINSLN